MNTPLSEFTPQDSAILLVNHQDATMKWVKSQSVEITRANVRLLARLGSEIGIPLIVTSTMESEIGTNIEDIRQLAPEAYARRIQRGAVFNAFLVEEFRDAVKQTGRKNLILAGLTTDVCVFNTARGAVKAGYNVEVVADACGGPSPLATEVTFARLRDAGVVVTAGNQLLMSVFESFETPAGKKAERIGFDELISTYGK